MQMMEEQMFVRMTMHDHAWPLLIEPKFLEKNLTHAQQWPTIF